MTLSQKIYWDQIYLRKNQNELSWFEKVPKLSLDLIHNLNLPKNAKIIDIGGGDSFLVDFLISEGFSDITVLDISEVALNKLKSRLGENAYKVKWIVADINEFVPNQEYDLWHDRATFHFLTNPDQIDRYVNLVRKSIHAFLIIATFSKMGPEKCSGLTVSQYEENQIQDLFLKDFRKVKCLNAVHKTPMMTEQEFIYCSFEKLILEQ